MAQATATIGIKSSAFTRGLDAMRSQTAAWAGDMKSMIGGAFAFGAALSFFNNFRDHLGRVKDLADRFGQSTDVVQRVGNVAKLSGSDLEFLATTLTKLTLEAAKGSESFAQLGINAADFAAADYQQQVLMLAQAWEEANGNTDKQAQLMQLLGAKGQDLMPMLAKGVAALNEEFGNTPIVASQAIESMTAFNDLVDGLGQKSQQIAGNVVLMFQRIGAAAAAGWQTLTTGGTFGDNFQRIIDQAGMLDEQITTQKPRSAVLTEAERKAAADAQKAAAEALKTLDAEMLALARSRMSEEEKITDLKREQAQFAALANDRGKTDAERADAATRVLQIQQQIESAQKSIAKTKDDEARKVAEKQQRQNEDALRAENALAEEQNRQRLAALDPAGRIAELKRQQKALQDAAKNDPDRQSAAEKKLEALKLNDQINSAQKELDSLKPANASPAVISSSLAAVGGGGGAYVSNFDPALAESRRQTTLLQQIANNTRGTAPAAGTAANPF